MSLIDKLENISFEFNEDDLKMLKTAFVSLKAKGQKEVPLKKLAKAMREEKGLSLSGNETILFSNALAATLEKIQGVKVLKPAPKEGKSYSLRVVDFSGVKA